MNTGMTSRWKLTDGVIGAANTGRDGVNGVGIMKAHNNPANNAAAIHLWADRFIRSPSLPFTDAASVPPAPCEASAIATMALSQAALRPQAQAQQPLEPAAAHRSAILHRPRCSARSAHHL